MNFQQLNYVVEISKCGSINKAANKLFLSQSGISTAIRELEEELGIQFFVRSNRGVEFTPDGREFLGYAASLLEQKQWIDPLWRGAERRSGYASVRLLPALSLYGGRLHRAAPIPGGQPLSVFHPGGGHGRRYRRRV